MMDYIGSWHSKALLSDKFSGALQICRRAQRYQLGDDDE